MPYFYKRLNINRSLSLNQIAAQNGFTNPGPIVSFPLNQGLWNMSVNGNYSFPSSIVLAVPKTQDYLRNKIPFFDQEIARLAPLRRDIREMASAQGDIQAGRLAADLLSGIVLFVCSAGMSTAAQGGEVEMEVIEEALRDRLLNIAGSFDSMANDHFKNRITHTIHTLMRHLTGIVTPSWWADAGVALLTGDPDIFWDGADEVHNRMLSRCRRNLDRAFANYTQLKQDATNQIAMSFYNDRI